MDGARERHFKHSNDHVVRSVGHLQLGPVSPRDHGFDLFQSYEANPTAERSSTSKRKPPRLVATASGTIDRILFSIPKYAMASPGLEAMYRCLFATLPDGAHIIAATHDATASSVREMMRARNHPDACGDCIVVPIGDDTAFSIWAEDPFVAIVEDTGVTCLVEPYRFERGADNQTASRLAEFDGTNIIRRSAPLIFQGGNLLIGDDFLLIGADYAVDSLHIANRRSLFSDLRSEAAKRDAILSWFRKYLDAKRKIYFIGSDRELEGQQRRPIPQADGGNWKETIHFGNRRGTIQPLFHLDMFMSLAGRHDGKNRVVIGDSRLAATLMNVELPPHAVAEADALDYIARQLANMEGFDVVRNPLPLIYVDDSANRTRLWYYATSNNVLLQDVPNDRRVWLPTYAYGPWEQEMRAVDVANERVWTDLGYRVTRLPDSHHAAEHSGVVHCMKKNLARGDVQ